MSLPSPCTSVCRIASATGWCEGCFRTLDEIATWGTLDDRAKAAVWQMLPVRRREAAGSGATGAGAEVDAPPPVGGSYPR